MTADQITIWCETCETHKSVPLGKVPDDGVIPCPSCGNELFKAEHIKLSERGLE